VQIQWLEKNVNLGLLAERISSFFHDTDFETLLERVSEGYVIKAVSKIPNLQLRIDVSVLGEPNDFIVGFLSGGKGGYFSSSMVAGYLTSVFGGGYLVRDGVSKREVLDMFESRLWKHVQMQVADLVGSATKAGKDEAGIHVP